MDTLKVTKTNGKVILGSDFYDLFPKDNFEEVIIEVSNFMK